MSDNRQTKFFRIAGAHSGTPTLSATGNENTILSKRTQQTAQNKAEAIR
jgi:hypothetical protein